MSLRDTVLRWLSRGDVAPDADEPIEIAVVSLPRGPLTVELLRSAGFHASGSQAYNIITEVSGSYRILVPRSEAPAAMQTLADWR